MKTRKETTIEDFCKVVTYKILISIRQNWKTLESFEEDYSYHKRNKSKESNMIYSRIVKSFHIEHNLLVNIAGRDAAGAKQLKKFLNALDRTKLVYVHKKTATYKKTGKTFNADSYFYIPFEELKRLFAMMNEKDSPFKANNTSGYYTKRQHELIDKWILNYRKERSYIKTEDFYRHQELIRIRRATMKARKLTAKSAEEMTEEDVEELIDAVEVC